MRPCGKSRRLQLNNKGVTLIELIVALLILGIIVVPLMSLFTSAARTNSDNSKRSDADIVAQNVMEAVKVYGLEKTAEQVYNYNPANAGSKVLGLRAEDKEDVSSSYYNDKFHQNDANIYEYVLKGVKEGDHQFDVKITFDSNYTIMVTPTGVADPTPIAKDVNDVHDYVLSAFNDKTTVFVNPLSGSIYYDQEALSTISEMNADLKEAEYERDLINVQEANAELLRQYQEDLLDPLASPTPPELQPAPNRDDYSQKFPKDYADDISRTMNVVISEENIAEAGMSKKVFKINSGLDYIVPMGSGLVEGDSLAPVSIPKSGYCHDVTVDDIQTLYVMYTPYPYMCKSAFDATDRSNLITYQTAGTHFESYLTDKMLKDVTGSISFANENLVIENKTDKDIEVYVIIQGSKDIVYDYDNKLNVTVKNTGLGSVSIYSQAEISFTGTSTTTQQGILKMKDSEHLDKLVNVTITVTDGDLERTINSTIQR